MSRCVIDVVLTGSEGASGEQDGNAVDDRITAPADGAEHAAGIERDRLAADRACQPAEVFGLEDAGTGLG